MTVNDLDPNGIILHGKYKGHTIRNVMSLNMSYIRWAVTEAPYVFKTIKPKPKQVSLKQAAQEDPVEPDDDAISNHASMDRIRQQMIANGTFEF